MPDRPTRLVAVDPQTPDPALLRAAAEIVRAGGLVAFPTETVYGLGANALDADAVARIFAAKGRPATNPVIVHVANDEMLRQVVADWPAMAQGLARRFWPGPLTLVLPKNNLVPDVVTARGPTVAVRMPANPIALQLIAMAGVPVAAPSANRSSELSPTRAEHVWAGLHGRIDMILDGGPTTAGIESTVLDLISKPPLLLRPGPIPASALEAIIGPIRVRSNTESSKPLPSPGLLPRHYAPRTPIELHESRSELDDRAALLVEQGKRIGRVLLGGASLSADMLAMPPDAASYASELYAALHALDERGLDRVLVELPPDRPEWLAVRDRLTRAATK